MQILPGNYISPPRTANAAGQPRKVGVEIEFAGLTAAEAAVIIQRVLGGTIEESSQHSHRILGTALGTIKVELDAHFIHPDSADSETGIVSKAKAALGGLVQSVVPCELITEPLEFHKLTLLDPVVRHLRRAGARGTNASIAYAFGLHFNPMAASLKPDYLLAILRAFVIKNAEIRARIRPDNSRTLLGWANPYPPEYAELILDRAYEPDLDQLICDYLAANPGRNHDLDMLPVFAFLDERMVTERLGKLTFSPRPAFHYRLPDSLIDEPYWTPAKDWNRWVEVERTAEDILASGEILMQTGTR